MRIEFQMGDVIIWDPGHRHGGRSYVDSYCEEERIKYFSDLGYGSKKPKLFVYLCEIRNAPESGEFLTNERYTSGHSVIVELGTNKILTMVHPDEFRLATDEEF